MFDFWGVIFDPLIPPKMGHHLCKFVYYYMDNLIIYKLWIQDVGFVVVILVEQVLAASP